MKKAARETGGDSLTDWLKQTMAGETGGDSLTRPGFIKLKVKIVDRDFLAVVGKAFRPDLERALSEMVSIKIESMAARRLKGKTPDERKAQFPKIVSELIKDFVAATHIARWKKSGSIKLSKPPSSERLLRLERASRSWPRPWAPTDLEGAILLLSIGRVRGRGDLRKMSAAGFGEVLRELLAIEISTDEARTVRQRMIKRRVDVNRPFKLFPFLTHELQRKAISRALGKEISVDNYRNARRQTLRD